MVKKKAAKKTVKKVEVKQVEINELKEKVGAYLRGSYKLSTQDLEAIYKAL
jgi:hypothetical protein